MHCGSCVQRVEKALKEIPNVEEVKVSLEPPNAVVTMRKHLDVEELNKSFLGSRYLLQENEAANVFTDPNESSLKSYYPLFLVFIYLIGIVTIRQFINGFSFSLIMTDFMGGFFIAFSFFKLLDLRGFAASYSSYDIITKRWLTFGYIYPFIELTLGIGFLFFPSFNPLYFTTLLVMSVSIVGVLQSIASKREIKCACLGTVFNLPMGTVTIIEDGLMIAMSAMMILTKMI